MAKVARNYRLSGEVDALIKAEAARLSGEAGKKVSEADVIEFAIVKWCSVGEEPENLQSVQNDDSGDVARNSDIDEGENQATVGDDRWESARAAMRAAGSAPVPTAPKVNKSAETVAQRRAREAKEHAAELAESDVAARLTGRDDIEYDLENVPHRSVADPAPARADGKPMEPIIQRPGKVYKKTWGPLARPHGKTEAKRRREQ